MGAWQSPLGDLPPSPDGPLTTQVTCRAGTRGRGAKHDITLAADWSLTTPHDLDAERILAAFGGTLSCINLNDVVVPALHELVQLSARRRLAGVRRTDRSRWILTRRTCTRCHDRAFRTPADAARHERTLDHWVGATRADKRTLGRLYDAVGQAHFDPDTTRPRRAPDGPRGRRRGRPVGRRRAPRVRRARPRPRLARRAGAAGRALPQRGVPPARPRLARRRRPRAAGPRRPDLGRVDRVRPRPAPPRVAAAVAGDRAVGARRAAADDGRLHRRGRGGVRRADRAVPAQRRLHPGRLARRRLRARARRPGRARGGRARRLDRAERRRGRPARARRTRAAAGPDPHADRAGAGRGRHAGDGAQPAAAGGADARRGGGVPGRLAAARHPDISTSCRPTTNHHRGDAWLSARGTTTSTR